MESVEGGVDAEPDTALATLSGLVSRTCDRFRDVPSAALTAVNFGLRTYGYKHISELRYRLDRFYGNGDFYGYSHYTTFLMNAMERASAGYDILAPIASDLRNGLAAVGII